jgi:hypothetical protein
MNARRPGAPASRALAAQRAAEMRRIDELDRKLDLVLRELRQLRAALRRQ